MWVNPPDEKWGRERWTLFYQDDQDLALLATRVPVEVAKALRKRRLGTTVQLVVEHALVLYLGSRLPPDIAVGPTFVRTSGEVVRKDMFRSPLRRFAVRIPRSLLRWVRTFAAQAEVTEQEVVLRAFAWYLDRHMVAPTPKEAERDPQGILYVGGPLLALKYQGYEAEQLGEAVRELLADQAVKAFYATQEVLIRDSERSGRKRRSQWAGGP